MYVNANLNYLKWTVKHSETNQILYSMNFELFSFVSWSFDLILLGQPTYKKLTHLCIITQIPTHYGHSFFFNFFSFFSLFLIYFFFFLEKNSIFFNIVGIFCDPFSPSTK